MAKEKKAKKIEKVEKEFVIGLQEAYNIPRPRRAEKTIFLIKKFMFKHFRATKENVLISNAVNEFLWKNGREHTPRKIAVKVIFIEGKVNVFLKGEKAKLPKEEKKEETLTKEEKKEEVEKEKKKMTEEEKAMEAEKEKKKDEKKLAEKAAEKSSIKRG